MNQLSQIINRQNTSAYYQMNSAIEMEEIKTICQENNYQLFYLNGEKITNKKEFLTAIATEFNFPDYFGDNWDALEDCLSDLHWLNGEKLLILYDRAEIFQQCHQEDYLVALDVLKSVSNYWQDKAKQLLTIINYQQSM